MNDSFFENAVFFFAAKRVNDAFSKFCEYFNLSLSPTQGVFEIVDDNTGQILHEEGTLAGILNYLEANPDRCFDFYLASPNDEMFTFSFRPKGYHVMSVPYDLFDLDALRDIIDKFGAIYGWGAGEDTPPPDSINEIRAAAGSPNSPFLRYHDMELILGNVVVG